MHICDELSKKITHENIVECDILNLLRGSYDGCQDVHELKRLASGRNHVYVFSAALSKFVVKASASKDAQSRMVRNALVALRLGEVGCSVEQPVLTKFGEPVCYGPNGLTVTVFQLIEGSQGNFTVSTYTHLGFALAKLHKSAALASIPKGILVDLSPKFILDKAELEITRLLGECEYAGRMRNCAQFIAAGLHRFASIHHATPTLGHGDPHPLNVIFPSIKYKSTPAWIDFEDAYVGCRMYDLGVIVWSTFRCAETKPLWMAALNSYNHCYSLDKEELDHIGLFVAFRQIWWLSMHAENWGSYDIHQREPNFLNSGIELLEIICHDACGM